MEGARPGRLVRTMQVVYGHTGLRRGASLIDKLPERLTGPQAVWTETGAGPLLLNVRDLGCRDLLLRGRLSNEPNETALFRRLLPQVRGFLDIGASYGFYTRLAATLMPSGDSHRVAIEANSRVLPFLKETLADVAEVVHAVASSRRGVAAFYEATASSISSPVRQVGQRKDVASRTVDELWPDRPLDLIKCDVEGGELEVLRGARTTRSRQAPIWMLEVDPELLREADVPPETLAQEVMVDASVFWLQGNCWRESNSLAVVAETPRQYKNVLVVPDSRRDWFLRYVPNVT